MAYFDPDRASKCSIWPLPPGLTGNVQIADFLNGFSEVMNAPYTFFQDDPEDGKPGRNVSVFRVGNRSGLPRDKTVIVNSRILANPDAGENIAGGEFLVGGVDVFSHGNIRKGIYEKAFEYFCKL